MAKDDNDASPRAHLDESHTGSCSWHPPEPFEFGLPPEEWGAINFDDLGFNWPNHLIEGQGDRQPALAPSPSTNTTLDYELVDASQPSDEAQPKHENTQTSNREAQEPPDLTGLPHDFRPEQSRRSVTVQSRSDSTISRESSTPSSTLNLTPGSSSASNWTFARHGSESFQPHPLPSNARRIESLHVPRSEDESYTDYSLLSDDTRTVVGSNDISEEGFGESPWALLRDTGLTDAQSGVQALTYGLNNSFLVVPSEHAIHASHSAPASATGGSSLVIPVCLSPSYNQAPLEMLRDVGAQDRQQAKRKRDKDDAQSRIQTRKLREIGACLRCRIYKEKVPSTRQDLHR